MWALASLALALWVMMAVANQLERNAGDFMQRHQWVGVIATLALILLFGRLAHATFDLVFPPH
jgi:branched-subunit amino acid permease